MTLVVGLVMGSVRASNASMLYLVPVLGAAVWGGRGPAVLAAVLAFLAFNWFFVGPLHTFAVEDPQEWMALLLFLLTAMVTGELAAAQRRRAEEAEVRRREAAALYAMARLLADPDVDGALAAVAKRLRMEMHLRAVGVCIDHGGGQWLRAQAGAADQVAQFAAIGRRGRLLGEGSRPSDTLRGMPGRWVRLVHPHPPGQAAHPRGPVHVVSIRVADQQAGALLIVPGARPLTPSDDRLLAAVAAQIGTALDRERLRHEATEAEILRRTDELKSALLNTVSHDLRTPLASIIAAAGSLRQDDVAWTTQERGEFVLAIHDEARRLDRLVGNLLDLSRIEGGALRPEKGWYDLAALVDDVLGRLRPITMRHTVHAEIADGLAPVHLDYVEMDQVLSNLLENAVKHTPPGTAIRIAGTCGRHLATVLVEDEGPGIPTHALPRVFEPFYRADGSGDRHTTGVAGSGLGLAVARGLVEAHGGRLWAENRPGGGARFTLTLPLPADAPLLEPSG